VWKVGEDGDRPPRREDWSRPGELEDLEPHLARFAIDELDVPGLLHPTREFFEYPMCDRDPLPRWTHGRITLIGDARPTRCTRWARTGRHAGDRRRIGAGRVVGEGATGGGTAGVRNPTTTTDRGARTAESPRWPGAEPLVWEAQAVTLSYERARGLRAVGQQADGFAITASRTVHVPTERLFDAFSDETVRQNWLPDGELRQRTATRPRSARYDWGGGDSRVLVTFDAKGPAQCTVAIAHARLADADQAEQQKLFWPRTPDHAQVDCSRQVRGD
jgi:hypothetical protein